MNEELKRLYANMLIQKVMHSSMAVESIVKTEEVDETLIKQFYQFLNNNLENCEFGITEFIRIKHLYTYLINENFYSAFELGQIYKKLESKVPIDGDNWKKKYYQEYVARTRRFMRDTKNVNKIYYEYREEIDIQLRLDADVIKFMAQEYESFEHFEEAYINQFSDHVYVFYCLRKLLKENPKAFIDQTIKQNLEYFLSYNTEYNQTVIGPQRNINYGLEDTFVMQVARKRK